MKTIVKYIGQYKKDSILTPLFTALEVVMEVLLPFITAKIIDNGLQAGNMQAVYQYGIVMLVMVPMTMNLVPNQETEMIQP